MSIVSDAALAAEEWMQQHLECAGVRAEDLSDRELRELSRFVPCSIRCWRVGVAIPTPPGEKCPECGRVEPEPIDPARLNYAALIAVEEGRR